MNKRPWNETAQDLANENEIVSACCIAWRCEAFKLNPLHYGVDFALTRNGTITAWAEIKARSRQYDPMFISAAKVAGMTHLANTTGKPALVIFGFSGVIYWHAVEPGRYAVTLGGRTDRGQAGDIEPVVGIPFAALKPLKK